MDCPRCNAEMVTLESEDHQLQRCEECGGLWVDSAELNRILVHNNLPVLDRFGGKSNLEEIAGTCPECKVDLTVVEGTGANSALYYESCESCGGVFLEPEEDSDGGFEKAEKAIAAMFKQLKPT